MGTYDTLIDSKNNLSCQVKIFDKRMRSFKVGEELPLHERNLPQNFSVQLPEWEDCEWVIIRDGKLYKLTDDVGEIILPIYDKWGKLITSLKTTTFNPSSRLSSSFGRE